MESISEIKSVTIGIDCGYGNIKTAYEVLRCGIENMPGDAIASESVLTYQGDSYVVGTSHLAYRGEKTVDDKFYLLILAAIAEELKYRADLPKRICSLP